MKMFKDKKGFSGVGALVKVTSVVIGFYVMSEVLDAVMPSLNSSSFFGAGTTVYTLIDSTILIVGIIVVARILIKEAQKLGKN